MRTKSTKEKKNSKPVVEQREPTDAELRALEQEHGADEDNDTEDLGVFPEVTADMASTPVDLARIGLNQIAYIRRSVVDAQPVWSIHSAAGHPLGAALTFEQAWGAVVQNELQPMYVN
jgi:hypothetical protein